MAKQKRVTIQIECSKELKQKLNKIAKLADVSIDDVVSVLMALDIIKQKEK